MDNYIILGFHLLPKSSPHTKLVLNTLKNFKLIEEKVKFEGLAYYTSVYDDTNDPILHLGTLSNEFLFTSRYTFDKSIVITNTMGFQSLAQMPDYDKSKEKIIEQCKPFSTNLHKILLPITTAFDNSTSYKKSDIKYVD